MDQTPVTYFRRFGKVTEEDKMHLLVDHYMEYVEIDEEEIEKVLIEQCSPDMRTYNPETKRAVFRILETDCDRAAKAIIQLIKREK